MSMNLQKVYRTPNRLDQKRNSLSNIIMILPNAKQRKNIKAVREKGQVTYKEFLSELHQTSHQRQGKPEYPGQMLYRHL